MDNIIDRGRYLNCWKRRVIDVIGYATGLKKGVTGL